MPPDLHSSDLLLNGVRTKPGRDLELREMRPPLIDPRRRHPSSHLRARRNKLNNRRAMMHEHACTDQSGPSFLGHVINGDVLTRRQAPQARENSDGRRGRRAVLPHRHWKNGTHMQTCLVKGVGREGRRGHRKKQSTGRLLGPSYEPS